MQLGVTVALATVWLAVLASADVPGAAATPYVPFRLTFDQYSPPPSHRHGAHGRAEASWKDRDLGEDQPLLAPSIVPRASILADGAARWPFEVEADESAPENSVATRDTPTPGVSTGTGTRERFSSREIARAAAQLDDPFVADDAFQDQGPGSVEIYKLDLFKEKSLLSPAPAVAPTIRHKSKAPKKTARVGWKTKPAKFKSTTPRTGDGVTYDFIGPSLSRSHHKQSNFFDDPRTDVPPNGEAFGVGGVPELQVGCEGLEASSHKSRRSADTAVGDASAGAVPSPWLRVTPVSLDLDYEPSAEEGYEEIDELVKLKRLEATTKRTGRNRGDMEATFNSHDFFGPTKREKLPVRGDLGESVGRDAPGSDSQKSRMEGDEGGREDAAERREDLASDAHPSGRRLLWARDTDGEDAKRSENGSELWGFGEDEGVATSDELQSENRVRHREDERRRQEEARRRESHRRMNESDSEAHRIRQENENALIQRERHDGAGRALASDAHPSGRRLLWARDTDGEDAKRSEKRSALWGFGEDEGVATSDELQSENRVRHREDERRRQEHERRRQEEARRQESHRRVNESNSEADRIRQEYENALRQREREDEERRLRFLGEGARGAVPDERQLEEERRRQDERRRQEEENRRNSGDRSSGPLDDVERLRRLRDEERRRQEEERRKMEERRRQESEEEERRKMEERRRQESEEERRQMEERRRQESEEQRRRVDQQTRQPTPEEQRRRWQEEQTRRREEEERRRGSDPRRRNRVEEEEEDRRRRYEEEARRRAQAEIGREDRRREEEERRRSEEENRRSGSRSPERNLAPADRRNLDDRIREWLAKRRQEEEEESRRREDEERRRNESPASLTHPDPRYGDVSARRREEERRLREMEERRGTTEREEERKLRDREEERQMRQRQEEERERMLREYVRRNRPVAVSGPDDRRRDEENNRRRSQEQSGAYGAAIDGRPEQNVTAGRDLEAEYRRQEEQRRRKLDEERKLQEYIRRNQPVNAARGSNESALGRDWLDERRAIEAARRQHDRWAHAGSDAGRRHHGPSAPTSIDPRAAYEDARRMEEARRLDEDRRRMEEARRMEDDRRRMEVDRRTMEEDRRRDREDERRSSRPTSIDPRGAYDDARRLQEARRMEEERRRASHGRRHDDERERAEAGRAEEVRREEEARRVQSARYEEQRRRQEAARLEEERRRQELAEEQRRRSQAGGTSASYAPRRQHEDRRPLEEHARRQQTSGSVPGNLLLDESRRAAERERQRQEIERRRRLEAERLARNDQGRRQQEDRTWEHRQREGHAGEQRRRQEEARLNSLPVSARIIVRSGGSLRPTVASRAGFENEIDFPGINPHRRGVEAARFPAAATTRPPARSPGPCVWAVVQCCPSNRSRLVTCFESMGCPGVNWDPNPCRGTVAQAARSEVMKFYAEAERGQDY